MSGQVRLEDSVVDVGTGGGLPGIPLRIAFPKIHVSLLEATEKKVRFLELVGLELGLENLEVLHARAEDAGRRASLQGILRPSDSPRAGPAYRWC